VYVLFISTSAFADDITLRNNNTVNDVISVEQYILNDARELDFILNSNLNIYSVMMSKVIDDCEYVSTMLGLDQKQHNTLLEKGALSEQNHSKLQFLIEENIAAIQGNMMLSDEQKAISIVKYLFWLKNFDFRDIWDYNFSFFMANADNKNASQEYFIEKIKLDKAVNKFYDSKDIAYAQIFIKSVRLENEFVFITADANTYYLYDDGSEGHATSTFNIQLIKENEFWLITDIRSTDLVEQYYLAEGISLDIDQLLAQLAAPIDTVSPFRNLETNKLQWHIAPYLLIILTQLTMNVILLILLLNACMLALVLYIIAQRQ